MVLQTGNGDHEIVAARMRQHQIIQARMFLFSRKVGIENLNGAIKVGDQHPDLLHSLSR